MEERPRKLGMWTRRQLHGRSTDMNAQISSTKSLRLVTKTPKDVRGHINELAANGRLLGLEFLGFNTIDLVYGGAILGVPMR
jgi:hypothetical protein